MSRRPARKLIMRIQNTADAFAAKARSRGPFVLLTVK
jgi:hypothetical protein